MSDIITGPRPQAIVDTECYRNYWLFKAKRPSNGTIFGTYKFGDTDIDKDRIRNVIARYEIIHFNGRNYDMPMIYAALAGFDCSKLKDISDFIIQTRAMPWDVEREFNFRIPRDIAQIDLIQVAPGVTTSMVGGMKKTERVSLKTNGGRVHSKKIQDLPFAHDSLLTWDQAQAIDLYCDNDLQTTQDLAVALKPELELRRTLSARYSIDLMSKSDPQMAEAVFKHLVYQETGNTPKTPPSQAGKSFKFVAPKWIKFKTKQLQDVLELVQSVDFEVSEKGVLQMPEALESLEITLGEAVLRMGMGGIHSSEKTTTWRSTKKLKIKDRDVKSYYPTLIDKSNLYPPAIGPVFNPIYKGFIVERLTAKAKKDKVTSEAFKIFLNGCFGKLNDKFSIFYSPSQLIQVTLPGQLALLMVIEELVLADFEVISANTDGIVTLCPTEKEEEFNAIFAAWEKITGFETEETEYKSLHSRDVNCYLAIYSDEHAKREGKTSKGKNDLAPRSLKKNPSAEICIDALTNFLVDGVPVEATIRSCNDIRKFVCIQAVGGGGIYAGEVIKQEVPNEKKPGKTKSEFVEVRGGQYLGKTVRWIYSTISEGLINYSGNGNKVSRTDGCYPMMELPDDYTVPWHLDYDWYINEANSVLETVGMGRDTSRWEDHLV